MKLQSKYKGTWRDVCEFADGHAAIVEDAAWRIAMCTPDCPWRIQPDRGEPRYLNRQARVWRTIEEARVILLAEQS